MYIRVVRTNLILVSPSSKIWGFSDSDCADVRRASTIISNSGKSADISEERRLLERGERMWRTVLSGDLDGLVSSGGDFTHSFLFWVLLLA